MEDKLNWQQEISKVRAIVEIDKQGNITYKNDKGEIHRIDGPAIEFADGTKAWFINGLLHREDGPALEFISGGRHWYVNGKRHREDGPAIVSVDGTKCWLVKGERHRIDGPAIVDAYGNKKWFINGIEFERDESIPLNIQIERIQNYKLDKQYCDNLIKYILEENKKKYCEGI